MQLEFFDVPSPCIGVCQSDEKGHCRGCMRSRDERQDWKDLNNDEKQKVIKRCIQRTKRKNNQGKIKIVEPKASPLAVDTIQPSLLDPSSKTKLAVNSDLDFSDFDL